ncbi:MAG: cytochrome c [Polyangia bacterium]
MSEFPCEAKGRSRQEGACCALLCLALAAGCEDDMSDQPRYDPLEPSPLFADGRSARPQLPGTIHRDEALDPVLNTAVRDGRLVDELPLPVSRELLLRGQERFTVYCTPCHSPLGDGDGMVVRRGFRRPPSLHDERLRLAPLGHFFDVMTNGFAVMPRFSYLLSPRDRWAIAAYIRVLQHSQHAALRDVPPPERQALEQSP